MAKALHSGKAALFVLIAIVGGGTGYGYFKQTSHLQETPAAVVDTATVIDATLLSPKPGDIIMGDVNALNTIVEYSSLSCPHCAHFHEKVLPDLEKEFITTGKAKLILRHFPLNDPALKASIVVECAGNANLKRENFIKVFFSMQAQWAFAESYLADLKQIALVGGLDSAAFDSCVNDKALEERILAMRQMAETKLKVASTPYFFINGEKYVGELTIEGFRKILGNTKPSK